jgi:hypothetical protein
MAAMHHLQFSEPTRLKMPTRPPRGERENAKERVEKGEESTVQPIASLTARFLVGRLTSSAVSARGRDGSIAIESHRR